MEVEGIHPLEPDSSIWFLRVLCYNVYPSGVQASPVLGVGEPLVEVCLEGCFSSHSDDFHLLDSKMYPKSYLEPLHDLRCCFMLFFRLPLFYDDDAASDSWLLTFSFRSAREHKTPDDTLLRQTTNQKQGCCFGCLRGVSKSVQVLFSGIEAAMVLTLITLK